MLTAGLLVLASRAQGRPAATPARAESAARTGTEPLDARRASPQPDPSGTETTSSPPPGGDPKTRRDDAPDAGGEDPTNLDVPQARTQSGAAPFLVFADLDDDDDDGVADSEQDPLGRRAAGVLYLQAVSRVGRLEGGIARFIAGNKPWHGSGRAPRRLGLQGLAPGATTLEIDGVPRRVSVLDVMAVDDQGARVDLARSHASMSRVLPLPLNDGGPTPARDPDALRWVVAGPLEDLPEAVALTSTRPDGSALDHIARLPLEPAACPSGSPPLIACRTTAPIRATSDQVDRRHPSFAASSIQAEVGGRLTVSAYGRRATSVRVGGPRVTALGPIERLRATLRTHVLRGAPGAAPAVGGNERGARNMVAHEIEVAAGIWGQCGVNFGMVTPEAIAVEDPPPPFLLAVGCDFPLPASGGELRFSVGGRRARVTTEPGETPIDVAVHVAHAVEALGFSATVSPNPRTQRAALRSADVLVRARDGSPATLGLDGSAPLSSDRTLAACLGEVDLADGLDHFTDVDARAGTIEERTLVKAVDDGDPATIDVFLIPAFGGSGRIGESFVDDGGAAIQNVVLIDRAAVRAGPRSYVLAHEIGHILLDLPGHPDDYGVDQPSDLMDADAADPSIFGPRRLSIEECERAVRQSGPKAPVPLLTPWPLTQPASSRKQR